MDKVVAVLQAAQTLVNSGIFLLTDSARFVFISFPSTRAAETARLNGLSTACGPRKPKTPTAFDGQSSLSLAHASLLGDPYP